MAIFAVRTFQLALGAVALTVAGFASAQTGNVAAPAAAPAAAEVVKPVPKKMQRAGHHHHHRHGHKHHGHGHRHDGKAGMREEAAARSEAQRGRLDNGQGATQFERNAFARCEVFKTDIDRRACADRVKQGSVSGTVEGGGILRESTIQVPVGQ